MACCLIDGPFLTVPRFLLFDIFHKQNDWHARVRRARSHCPRRSPPLCRRLATRSAPLHGRKSIATAAEVGRVMCRGGVRKGRLSSRDVFLTIARPVSLTLAIALPVSFLRCLDAWWAGSWHLFALPCHACALATPIASVFPPISRPQVSRWDGTKARRSTSPTSR